MALTPLSNRRGPKPKVQTRENLLRAGTQFLHKVGYSAAGVQDIAGAAHVPKGSFYNYFGSKEAFAKESVDFYFKSGLKEIQEILGDTQVSPLKRLQNYFEKRINDFEKDDFLKGCLMGNLSLEVADHSETIRKTIADHFKT